MGKASRGKKERQAKDRLRERVYSMSDVNDEGLEFLENEIAELQQRNMNRAQQIGFSLHPLGEIQLRIDVLLSQMFPVKADRLKFEIVYQQEVGKKYDEAEVELRKKKDEMEKAARESQLLAGVHNIKPQTPKLQ